MANTLELGNGKWATGKDTVLAFNDENNNFKPLPFSFSRASSGTVVNKDGLIETVGSGEPRIDFKDNTKGALLLEPQRTNVIINSENLNGSGWNVFGASGGTVTRTSNYGISPSGELNSTRVVFSDGTTALYASASGITDNASTSIYVKGTVGEIIGFGFGGSVAGGSDFIFNGEWQRLEFNGTSANSNLTINTWSASRNARDFEVYGVQMEQGSYPTSYIPTSGGAVTRVAESSSQTVPDGIYGTNEVTFVIDFEINGDTPTYSSIFNTNKNTASSFGVTRQEENGRLKPFLFSSGVNVGDMTSTTAFLNDVRGKFAVGYKNGDSVLVVKGNVEDTNSATFSDFNVNEIHLNDLVTFFGYHTNLKIYDFKLYNTRLSNSELAALTQ